jgi:hypothetical protein
VARYGFSSEDIIRAIQTLPERRSLS